MTSPDRRRSRFLSIAILSAGLTAAPLATAVSTASVPAGDRLATTATLGSQWRGVHLDVRNTPVAGTSIAWATVGSPSASVRPLLMLNGTGSPMAEWDPALLAQLASSRQVIVLDYPGLGESGRNPGAMSFRSLADTTAAFIQAIGLDSVDILGWSMGGFVAQELLRSHSQLVGRAVLAGTNPGGPKTKLGPRWVQEADSDPGAGIGTYLKTNYPDTRRAQRKGRAFVKRLTKSVNSGRYPNESVPAKTYRQMVRAEGPWLRSKRNSRQLRTVSTRVLVITGKQDLITPRANSRRIAKLLPNAKLKLVAGSGHSFLFQKPERVGKQI
ncbi:MAG: alpha/beta hydrolase, partial [Actinobacteria bacterium]|nr:alpha/beta hydrolase [Actinomycetota bacterium]